MTVYYLAMRITLRKTIVKNKDSSRKATERKVIAKNTSTSQLTGTRSRFTKRHKVFEYNEAHKPFFRYLLPPDDIIALISRVAHFNKKQLEKLDKLLVSSQPEKTEEKNNQQKE